VTAFFAGRPPGEPGLVVFLNAGDPPLDVLRDVVRMLDDCGVDGLELAVPFPDSPYDGPAVRRSAQRALAGGIALDDVLAFVAAVRPTLRHLRIVLVADWSHTARHRPDFMAGVRASGSDALLLLGPPPRLVADYHEAAARAGVPVVATCYATSTAEVRAAAGRAASAYLYLVARYGTTGAAPRTGFATLTGVIGELRGHTGAPVAVGFGVGNRDDVAALGTAGADAVVVGSAVVSRVERALATGQDVVADLRHYVAELRGHSIPLSPVGGTT